MSSFPREELLQAYQPHRDYQDRGEWEKIADLFTEDGVYFDAVYGWQHGREEIRKFMRDSMGDTTGWEFPETFVLVDGDRLAFHWLNRLPGKRADGSFYEFQGLSALQYAGNGLWKEQRDIYDTAAAINLIQEWHEDQKK